MNSISLIKNSNGNNNLIYNEYRFRLSNRNDNTYYWRCSKHDSLKCPARLVTQHNGTQHILIKTSEHNHNLYSLKTCDNIFRHKEIINDIQQKECNEPQLTKKE